ncbi:aminotransferase class V-fold PLP-dependent enzyme [Xanthomonas sp. AmX2]|uniref:aminotransferase class V-fold PLP-dependent enzyme n=1 Tax=Xanthomonas sp. TaxID=29446 RepID=UPI00197F18D3|nr:aminotransferase class V-fold PLP-dependent enzyme [Xanthomonas sp.]MBN6152814.1 aminotransferase class V-fold PLP-dependent enzyme [Xanthomonas sp.]
MLPLPVPDAAPAPLVDLAHAPDAFILPERVRYLDTASKGPRLARVLAAGQAALAASVAPWTLSFDAWRADIETLRALAAELLFEGDGDGVAMVPSAAYGLATAARQLPLSAGDAVLLLDGQFPSNLLLWQQRCAESGASLAVVRPAPGQDWTDAVLAALEAQPQVRIATLPNAYWRDGALLDLDRIAPRVHACGAALLLDLSQSLGVLPARLAAWRPDFVVAVGHKWLLGPMGLAWLWASPHWRSHGLPIEHHWQARDPGADWHFPAEAAPPFRDGARRFDAGGVAEPLRLAMATAALQQLQHWRPASIAARLAELGEAFDAELQACGAGDWIVPGHAPHLRALRPPPAALRALLPWLQREQVICTHRHGALRIAPYLQLAPDTMHTLAREMVAAART